MANCGYCTFSISTNTEEELDEFKSKFFHSPDNEQISLKTDVDIFDLISIEVIQKANIDKDDLETQWSQLTRYGFQYNELYGGNDIEFDVTTGGFFPTVIADMFVALGYSVSLYGYGEGAEWIGEYDDFYHSVDDYDSFNDYVKAIFEKYDLDLDITEDEFMNDAADNFSMFEFNFLRELIGCYEDEDDDDDE